jgi:hypothetical protein
LAVVDGDLVVGGDFRRTAGLPAYFLGRWREAMSAVGVTETRTSLRLVVPNPLRPGATLLLANMTSGPVRVDLLDLNGRLVRRLRGDPFTGAIPWDGRDAWQRLLSPGRYFLRMDSKEGHSVRPILAWP